MLEWRMTVGIHLQLSPPSIRSAWKQQPATVGHFSQAAESSQEDDHLLPVNQKAPDHTETGGGRGRGCVGGLSLIGGQYMGKLSMFFESNDRVII